MLDILTDALLDSLKIFLFVLVFNFVFSFIEKNVVKKKLSVGWFSVPLGAALGLLPQCNFSIIASENYKKQKITAGTLVAVFAATSDEALPILLSDKTKLTDVIILLVLKFIIAIIVGYMCDFIFINQTRNVFNNEKNSNQPQSSSLNNTDLQEEHLPVADVHEHTHTHNHQNKAYRSNSEHRFFKCENAFIDNHLLHPLYHSLRVFIIVLLLNIIFAVLVYFIGEQRLSNFLQTNAYLAPLFSVMVGFIPNCASSVIISKLYIANSLSFGACLAGLIANAGLGISVLFGKNANVKNNLKIIGILLLAALISGYLAILIEGLL